MKWEIEQAKNGQATLKLNNVYLYSKYNPKQDVARFMEKEILDKNNKFILVGLGLGYHLSYLLREVENVEVQYILLDDKELVLYQEYCDEKTLSAHNVKKFINDEEFNKEAQIIIPQSFLNAIGLQHPLYPFIEDIKIRQRSFKRFKEQMEQNFIENSKLYQPLKIGDISREKAALVASGPSLKDTVKWLKIHEEEFDIYCVGSALGVLLEYDIQPKKIFMSDAQPAMLKQVDNDYCGELVFLSTANAQAVAHFKGSKQIIFQQGYSAAEQFAKERKQPLFETGGSVATTAFSFIEWLNYKELYLFGQDLGFAGGRTHVEGSTSGKEITENNKFLDILANDGSMIQSTPNLLSYKRWFDQAFTKTDIRIFNTAKKGAKLKNTVFLDIT